MRSQVSTKLEMHHLDTTAVQTVQFAKMLYCFISTLQYAVIMSSDAHMLIILLGTKNPGIVSSVNAWEQRSQS